jgi:hypothetical protein
MSFKISLLPKLFASVFTDIEAMWFSPFLRRPFLGSIVKFVGQKQLTIFSRQACPEQSRRGAKTQSKINSYFFPTLAPLRLCGRHSLIRSSSHPEISNIFG